MKKREAIFSLEANLQRESLDWRKNNQYYLIGNQVSNFSFVHKNVSVRPSIPSILILHILLFWDSIFDTTLDENGIVSFLQIALW